ncbi:MAG: cell surface protein SprA [Gemmatimonadota bacterium]|nr:cell surface protein SprA [Gemmatimonadota bacterium]MDQ8172149.1 cell surface protein SprA [Gemmatimonadota bacterium]
MRRQLQTWALPEAIRGWLRVASPPVPLVAAAAVVAAALFAAPAAAQPGAPRPAAALAGARLAADSVWLKLPPILGPFGAATALRPDPVRLADRAVRLARARHAERIDARWRQTVARDFAVPASAPAMAVRPDSGPTPGALVPLAPQLRQGADAATQLATDLLGDIGDLGISLNARLESKVQRSRNERCTTAQLTILGNNCFGIFQPAFDFQFNVRTGGVVADRVFVNVDYDSQREFDASNNISVRYQGKSDEALQTLEVGNVTFQPPPSRFLTSGIPSGNYGVQATGQIGPMRFTSIVAQQKGNVSKDNVFTIGEKSQQQVDRVIEDIQVETRRFFFTIDPRALGGYPNIDLLNRQQMQQLAASLPDSVRPVRLYVYRQLIGAANQNPRGPQFSVRGARNPSRQIYEVLRENVDYYVDPSQLWIALVRPLNPNNERLAVAYEVNVNGRPGRNVNTGGTPDIEYTADPQVANLLWEPELQPGNTAYFLRELKSVYRLGGEDLQRQSVALKLVTGTSGDQEKPIDASRGDTYLQMFGLAQATNSAVFDVENRVWPRPNDPNQLASFAGGTGQQKLIRDYFVFFPSVQPFARGGLAQPLANPANDTLYRYPNEYLYSAQRPQAIYRMVASYQSEGGGSSQSIKLSTIQVRPNSERVALDGRLLQKEVDYVIDYDLGMITFNRPDTLFATPRQVSVRYEENPLFAATPTTILGFSSQFPLDNGQIAFTAISQSQRSGYNRPPLGFEPVGSLVAGMTANLGWEAPLLSAALARLPFKQGTTPSRVSLQGEFAMSKPQPNAAGQAYIESFEGEGAIPGISLSEGAWYFSSRPSLGNTLAPRFGSAAFTPNRAATLAFQNNGVDVGGNFVQFNIQQIDPSVRIQGNGVQSPEQLLWMTLYPLKTGGIFDFLPGTATRRFAWTIGDNTLVGNTPSGRRWRSLRTVINPSGADLSRTENIEFFALVQSERGKIARNPTLVFDFGEISENSVAFAPETLTVNAPVRAGLPADTTYRGKRLVGFDRFDSERDPFSRAFNAVENDKGLPGDRADTIVVVNRTAATPVITTQNGVAVCTQAVQIVQVLGDSRANCGARNNRLDEEDIDLDGQLNMPSAAIDQEQYKRFIVDLADTRNWTRVGKCYQQQDSTVNGVVSDSLCWVQVRLNWRAPAEEQNTPNDRRVRALRLTMVSGAGAADDAFVRVALTRLKLVGAPWLKRSVEPLSGMAGDSAGVIGGYVIASVIGTLDSTSLVPYTPPPGVVEAPENRQTGYENNRVQVNERALRLQAGVPGRQFRPFDRAEAFFRFQEGTKTFMGYKTLRLWMRGRGNGWGQNGELNGYVKIGRDENNFYMYRTPVNAGPGLSAWEPEVRVDLQKFQILRAQLENNFLTGSADSVACTGADLELIRRSGLPRGVAVRRYAVCQDGYIVYSADPTVTPPNLAGVQEMAVGFVRVDSVPRGGMGLMNNDSLELWVNDIRLTDVVDDVGFAGEVGLAVNAGDLADFRLNVSRRDPNFRQLNETPSFLTTSGMSVGTTLHLERMLPARLGVVMPFSVDYVGTGVQQLFINRTDVRASGIDGLRNPSDRRVNYALALRRATPLGSGWYAPIVNGLALNGTWSAAASQSAFQETTNSAYVMGASLNLNGDRRESKLPRVVDAVVGLLPRGVRESEAVRAFRAQRVRWSPTAFRLSSALARNANSSTSYTKAAESPTDTGQVANGLTHFWQNSSTLEFRPTLGLSATMNARQLLDLRDYRSTAQQVDSTDRGQAATAERLQLLGTTLGLERERSLTSAVLFQPTLAVWLRPRVDFNSTFNLNKDPNARTLLREGDSTGAYRLPKRLGAAQTLSTGTAFDLGRLITSRTAEKSIVNRLGRIFAPVDVSWQQSLTSNFDNTAFIPGWGYQLGLGGVQSFRGLDSRLATTAGRLRRTTATGALNLPFSLTVQSRVENGTTETWTRRTLDGFQAVITSTQLVKPDYSVRWSWRPVRLRKVITMLNVNGRYLVSEQETLVPNETGGLADRSRTKATSQPLSGAITWAFLGGLTTNASLDRTHREDSRPGSLINGDTRRMSFDVARRFKVPKRWSARNATVRTSLSYQSEASQSVVQGASSTNSAGEVVLIAPSVLTDNGRRAVNFNADTDLSELLTFSLTGSRVVNFDRNYNRQTSNLIFSAVLQLRFFAGDLK